MKNMMLQVKKHANIACFLGVLVALCVACNNNQNDPNAPLDYGHRPTGFGYGILLPLYLRAYPSGNNPVALLQRGVQKYLHRPGWFLFCQ